MSGHHSFWGAGGSGEKRRIGLCFGCQRGVLFLGAEIRAMMENRREKAHTWIVGRGLVTVAICSRSFAVLQSGVQNGS